MSVKILPYQSSNPSGKLADAELVTQKSGRPFQAAVQAVLIEAPVLRRGQALASGARYARSSRLATQAP